MRNMCVRVCVCVSVLRVCAHVLYATQLLMRKALGAQIAAWPYTCNGTRLTLVDEVKLYNVLDP